MGNNMALSTFEGVKNWYERTTPIRGKRSEGLDIRPIGERRYKHQRIIKVDDNCYAISDGWHYGDPLNIPYDHGAGFKPTPEDTATYAPIVWRRHADGTETVAIRNAGYGSGTVATRHGMLRHYTPRGLTLQAGDRTGKHYIRCASGTHYMPKATMIPKAVFDARVTKNYTYGRACTLDDEATLVFRRAGDQFVLCSSAPVEFKTAVNKALKAGFREPIAEFRGWMRVIVPMLQPSYDEIRRHLAAVSDVGGARPTPKRVQEILLDPTHPLRVSLAVRILYDTSNSMWGRLRTTHDVGKSIASVTHWMNRYGGFLHQVPK